MSEIFHPDCKSTPYWWEEAPPVSAPLPVLPQHVDAVAASILLRTYLERMHNAAARGEATS